MQVKTPNTKVCRKRPHEPLYRSRYVRSVTTTEEVLQYEVRTKVVGVRKHDYTNVNRNTDLEKRGRLVTHDGRHYSS